MTKIEQFVTDNFQISDSAHFESIVASLEKFSRDEGSNHETKMLVDCIRNYVGVFNTPVARLLMKDKEGSIITEVRKIGSEIIKRYGLT